MKLIFSHYRSFALQIVHADRWFISYKAASMLPEGGKGRETEGMRGCACARLHARIDMCKIIHVKAHETESRRGRRRGRRSDKSIKTFDLRKRVLREYTAAS